MNAIADVQSSPDQRNMPINQVGIKDLHFPLQICPPRKKARICRALWR